MCLSPELWIDPREFYSHIPLFLQNASETHKENDCLSPTLMFGVHGGQTAYHYHQLLD